MVSLCLILTAKADYLRDQRNLCLSQYPGRAYHNWGRPLPPQPQALWARRSSWNSMGGVHPCSSSSPSGSPAFTSTSARPFYGYGLGGLGGMVGGSLRIRGPRASSSPHHHVHPDEKESLLSPPAVDPHSLHLPHPMLQGNLMPRRDRRALSLELPHLLQVPGTQLPALLPQHTLPPVTVHAHHRKKSFSGGTVVSAGDGVLERQGGLGGTHQDCNGKTPISQHLQPAPRAHSEQTGERNPQSQLIADVYPQVNTRSKDREDLDDDIEYVGYYIILYV